MNAKKLICVTEANNNKFYNMTDNNDGTFTAEYGRVDSTSLKKVYPISKWESVYASKIKKGYKDVTALYIEETSSVSKVADKKNPFYGIISRLQAFAKKMVADNYRVSTQAVTQNMIQEAQKLIDELVNDCNTAMKNFTWGFTSINPFNDTLLRLFSALPRKMKKVQDSILEVKADWTKDELYHEMKRIIRREQDMLDALAATAVTDTPANEETDILGKIGIEMKEKDADLENKVLDMLGDIKDKYVNCWYVENTKTQERYDAKVASQRGVHKTEMQFWHGSRNENWLSILQNGLMIRPSGVATTGSMFGNALYFADQAKKSAGYTSLRGSYWARGNSDTGFMAIFSVNVGKYHKVYKHTSECYDFNKDNLKAKGNFDSVYAIKGADLRNDEYMVYSPEQATIVALVELKA